MADDVSSLQSLIESVNRAWLEGRYDDLVPFVHESAVMAPPGGAAIQGREAFVRSYADFGRAATIHAFEPDTPRIEIWAATAVAECPFAIDYEIPAGRYRERGMELLVLTRTAAGWQICWRLLSSAPLESPG